MYICIYVSSYYYLIIIFCLILTNNYNINYNNYLIYANM